MIITIGISRRSAHALWLGHRRICRRIISGENYTYCDRISTLVRACFDGKPPDKNIDLDEAITSGVVIEADIRLLDKTLRSKGKK